MHQKPLQQELTAFMDANVYPNEGRFFAEIEENRRKGNAWIPTQIVETLKAKAQKAGLWNFFLPRSDRAPFIEPIAEATLRNDVAQHVPLKAWTIGRTEKISSGFYTSQAMELCRP